MAQAELPTFGKKKHKRQQLPAILQPTQKRPRCTASASERASSSTPSDGLKSILSKLGFVSFWPLFVREQVNVSIVASCDLAAMKAYFPDIPDLIKPCFLVRSWILCLRGATSRWIDSHQTFHRLWNSTLKNSIVYAENFI